MGIAQQLRQWGKATDRILQKLLPPEPGMEDLAAAVGYVENAGNPYNSVTPDFIGQWLFDTTNLQWYVARGITTTSWRPMMEGGVDASGNNIGPTAVPRITETLTGSITLTTAAFGAVTPYNSGSSGTLTLPDAATCWALKPYGLVVVTQKGTGVPSFAAGGSDTLRATSGVAACVQYGMCAAQVISATEWALA